MTSPSLDNPNSTMEHPVKYQIKFRQFVFFYIIVPGILVGLLIIGFFYLIDLSTVKIISFSSVLQYQPKEVLIERLPHDLKPSLYIITLQTFLPYKPGVDFGRYNRTVDGTVLLNFYCRKQTNRILLNANDLIIDENKLRLHDQDSRMALAVWLIEYRNETQMLEFGTDPPMLVGHNYSMMIIYGTRILEPDDRGLFLASYKLGNETRYHMVSQMQSIFARRVFPCFDEPEFKAEFQITIIHPVGTTAVSNTKLQTIRMLKNQKWLRSEFRPTPKMSTYILAVAVTDFPFLETYYRDIRIRVYVQPNHINYTHYVLSVLPKTLKYYEIYFDIKYPLQKLDVYAVDELSVSAMENWGLITAKDEAIIFHDDTSTINEKSIVDMTIFHEVAHMWFGNLITMRWWNDLWLNEGFATHMSTCAAKNLSTDLESLESIGEIRKIVTMSSEEGLTKPPLSNKINKRTGILTAFEGTNYYKGAAVLRQLERIIGANTFQRVLRDFILKHIYDNADSEDFIKSIIKSLGKSNPFGKHDVYESIKTWTHNRGFPLIIVNRLNDTSIQLSQECYRGSESKATPNHTWTIPLFFKHDFEQADFNVAILHGNESLILHNVVMVDPEYIGYFKILYDSQTLEKITRQLHKNPSVITTKARAKLIHDSLNLFQSDRLEIQPFLKLLQYLKNETNLLPIQMFNNVVDSVGYIFSGFSQFEQPLKMFWNFILAEPFQKYITSSTTNKRKFEGVGRLLILKTCFFNHAPCVNYVRSQLAQLKIACAKKKLSDKCNFIVPGCRVVVYAMALRHGTATDFNFLWEKLMIENVPMERTHISQGLSGTLNRTLSIKTFNYHVFNSTNPSKIYCQSFYNFYTLDVIRPYFESVFYSLIKRYQNSKFLRICAYIPVKVLVTEDNVKKLNDMIVEKKNLPIFFTNLWKKNLDTNYRLLALQKRHAPMLAQFLDEFNKKLQNDTSNHQTLLKNPVIVD